MLEVGKSAAVNSAARGDFHLSNCWHWEARLASNEDMASPRSRRGQSHQTKTWLYHGQGGGNPRPSCPRVGPGGIFTCPILGTGKARLGSDEDMALPRARRGQSQALMPSGGAHNPTAHRKMRTNTTFKLLTSIKAWPRLCGLLTLIQIDVRRSALVDFVPRRVTPC